MEGFRSSVRAICMVSAAVCIMGNLVSGTRLKSQMKLMLDLVLAVVIITPFVRGGLDFELPDFSAYETPDYGYSLELYNETLRKQTEENVTAVLRQQIAAAGISCDKIEAEVNISEDGSIFISRVTVRADNFELAAEIVRSSLGEDTEVVNGDP